MGSTASILNPPTEFNLIHEINDEQEKKMLEIYSDLTGALHPEEDTLLTVSDILQYLSTPTTPSQINAQLEAYLEEGLKMLNYLQSQLITSYDFSVEQPVTYPTFRAWILPHLLKQEVLFNFLHSNVKSFHLSVQKQTKEEESARLRSRLEGPPKYPMYVMRVAELLDHFQTVLARERLDEFSGLPKHEDAVLEGKLFEVVERPDWPGQYFAFHTLPDGKRGEAIKYPVIEDVTYETEEKVFHRARFLSISHQWLRPSRDNAIAHPDSSDRIKCRALMNFLSQSSSQDAYDFVWMDYFSIPQLPTRRDVQCLAISSLPTYFIYSTCTLILCKDMESFQHQQQGYLSRGHCLMELLTSKLPRIDVFNKWYVPGISKDGSWGHTTVYSMSNQTMKVLMWQDFVDSGSPLQGNFTVEEDRLLMKPLIEEYIKAFRRFDEEFVHRIREASTWKEVQEFPEELKPQLLGIPSRKILSLQYPERQTYPELQTPADLANFLLPKDYIDMLEKSLEDSR